MWKRKSYRLNNNRDRRMVGYMGLPTGDSPLRKLSESRQALLGVQKKLGFPGSRSIF
jgi:hypothetical protein